MSCVVRAADTTRSPITPAATAIARSARPVRHNAGSRRARPICLPVDYYHVVFTLPAPISAIAYYNKAVIYGLLFDMAAETLMTIAADPKHLGARIGATLVLHTWGSALTHHPHVHGIVPGGGLSLDGSAGSPAGPASSCPCACSRGCSGAASWKHLQRRIAPAGCSSSASTRRWPIRQPSPTGSRRCAPANGSSMPSVRSLARKRCWPICRATPTASPSPTAGLFA